MVSAAEQLASNLNFGAFAKAEDLKKRIWFTLGALIVYRFGTFIPMPGINPVAFAEDVQGAAAGILGMFNMFAGGAVERMAIFALNIMPYISASIIMQLMSSMSPKLEALKKEGEPGRKQINQYTRYLTVVLAAFQAYGIAIGLEGSRSAAGAVVIDPGWFFRMTTVDHAGRRHHVPDVARRADHAARRRQRHLAHHLRRHRRRACPRRWSACSSWPAPARCRPSCCSLLLALMLFVVAAIVFIERAQRRLLIQYPKRQVGNRMFQGDASHLPLKLNSSGVIPPIFASSLLLLPITAAQFTAGQGPEWLNDDRRGARPRPAAAHLRSTWR